MSSTTAEQDIGVDLYIPKIDPSTCHHGPGSVLGSVSDITESEASISWFSGTNSNSQDGAGRGGGRNHNFNNQDNTSYNSSFHTGGYYPSPSTFDNHDDFLAHPLERHSNRNLSTIDETNGTTNGLSNPTTTTIDHTHDGDDDVDDDGDVTIKNNNHNNSSTDDDNTHKRNERYIEEELRQLRMDQFFHSSSSSPTDVRTAVKREDKELPSDQECTTSNMDTENVATACVEHSENFVKDEEEEEEEEEDIEDEEDCDGGSVLVPFCSSKSDGVSQSITTNSSGEYDDDDEREETAIDSSSNTLYIDKFQPRHCHPSSSHHTSATITTNNTSLPKPGFSELHTLGTNKRGGNWFKHKGASLGNIFSSSSPQPQGGNINPKLLRGRGGRSNTRTLSFKAVAEDEPSEDGSMFLIRPLSLSHAVASDPNSNNSISKNEDQFAEMEAQCVGTKMELAKTNQTLEETRFVLTRKTSEHSQLLNYTQQLEEQEALAAESYICMKQQYDDAIKSFNELNKIVTKLREERVSYIKSLKDISTTLDETKKELKQCHNVIDEQKKEYNKKEKECTIALDQLKDMTDECHDLKVELHNSEHVIELMKQQANRSSIERNDLFKQLKRCEYELNQVSTRNMCHVEQNEELYDQLSALKEQLTMEQTKREDLEQQIHSMKQTQMETSDIVERNNNNDTEPNDDSLSSTKQQQKGGGSNNKIKFSWIANVLFPPSTNEHRQNDAARKSNSRRRQSATDATTMGIRNSSSTKQSRSNTNKNNRKVVALKRSRSHESNLNVAFDTEVTNHHVSTSSNGNKRKQTLLKQRDGGGGGSSSFILFQPFQSISRSLHGRSLHGRNNKTSGINISQSCDSGLRRTKFSNNKGSNASGAARSSTDLLFTTDNEEYEFNRSVAREEITEDCKTNFLKYDDSDEYDAEDDHGSNSQSLLETIVKGFIFPFKNSSSNSNMNVVAASAPTSQEDIVAPDGSTKIE